MLGDDRNLDDARQVVESLGLVAGQRVLDAPCGHGRISNVLALQGIQVCAIDKTSSFIDLARLNAEQLGATGDYRIGDIVELPSDLDTTFDAAINWFTSFGYHDDETCQAILARYRRVLKPGGRLLIETLHHDWIVRNLTPTGSASVARHGDDLMLDENVFDPLTSRIDSVRTVVRDGEVRQSRHFVRLPTAAELRRWLIDAGFCDVAITASDGQPLTLASRRLMAVARR